MQSFRQRVERIETLDDPRVAAYRNLPERTLRGESLFVAEGRLVVERLLRSRFDVESVFVAEQYVEQFLPLVAGRAPLYFARESLLAEVVGFKFHLGALAVGKRAALPRLEEVVCRLPLSEPLRLVVCPEVTKPENLGLVFRTAAAFGLDAVILGPQACDPLSRRALRVSMGASLFVPFVRPDNLPDALQWLKSKQRVELVATVVDPAAERLADFSWPERVAILVGGEYEGLSAALVEICDYRVTIPMHPAVDSLNLGVATGIFVYELVKQHPLPPRQYPGRECLP